MKRITANQKRSNRGEGRLYKRGKDGKEYPANSNVPGAFYIEYFPGGKRKRQRLVDANGESITTKRKAKEEQKRITAPFLAKEKVEQLQFVQAQLQGANAHHKVAHEEANPPLSMTDAWEAYADSDKRPDGEETLKNYRSHWKRFYQWLVDNEPEVVYLRDVTASIASEFMRTLRTGSANTYNKYLNFLKLAFKVLEEPGRITKSPFETIRAKTLVPNSRRSLSIEELKLVLTEATGDLEILFALGIFTGLRLADCATLRWNEIDLGAGVIRRIANKTRTRNKPPVVVGIPPILSRLLHEIPERERRGYLLPDIGSSHTRSGTRRITEKLQAHFIACGIQTHKEGTGKGTGKRAVVEVGFHSLRHSFVSLHASRGTPQSVVQAVVGHGSPAMTQHYTHITEGVAKGISGVIDLDEGAALKKELLPSWVRDKLEAMTTKNWKAIKRELLEHPVA